MGDPKFHEMEDELYEPIVESPYRAVIKTETATDRPEWPSRRSYPCRSR